MLTTNAYLYSYKFIGFYILWCYGFEREEAPPPQIHLFRQTGLQAAVLFWLGVEPLGDEV